ncbi:hypothetical protein AOC28_02845 [Polynucleobacter sp. MWH-Adler-W8]|nr:hypothetical protein AOC28_02845 [Polynucleobacter sp. MWH-Adler-W8]
MVNELNIPKSRNQLIALDYEAKVVNCHPPYSPIRGSLKGEMGSLACPARFERATYALEAGKMWLNNTKNNAFKVMAFGAL